MIETITPSRREMLRAMTGLAGCAVLERPVQLPTATTFTYCLNMSTLRGHKLGLAKELEVASKAGFRSVEIWMDSLQEYINKGGTLADVRTRAKDLGLTIENAIGFAPWIVDDPAIRSKGLEQLKKEMDQLAAIGCKRTAAPPMGATTTPALNLYAVADRYRTILELGDQTGVVPHLELWGFSNNLSKLSEVAFVAIQSGHPSARLLLDVYHLYKGGSSLDSLPLIGKSGIEIFHVNDYPEKKSPAEVTDADRVYTGDGVAPIRKILPIIRKSDTPLILSLEVFNKSYYQQDALTVAKTGLAKMKKVTDGL